MNKKIISVAALAAVFFGPVSHAQDLSQIRVATGSQVTSAAYNSYLTGKDVSTSTREFWGPDPTANRPVELKELARALRNNVDYIYEYVHDNVRTVFMYGLQKGALGAMIDQSGTPFDQAHLMVELLREAGYTASYKEGTIKLTPTQASAWMGTSNAAVQKQILSDGGIPWDLSGSDLVIRHVWVEVALPGQSCGSTCWFDPSYKTYTFKPTMSGLDTLMGMSGTEFDTTNSLGFFGKAWTGIQQQTTPADPVWVGGLNDTNIKSKLDGYATALLTALKSSTHKAKEIEDVIGGQDIDKTGSAAVRNNATLPNFAPVAQRTWSCTSNSVCGIPDPWRTKLMLKMLDRYTGTFDVRIKKSFFADEIYGRRLMLDTPQTASLPDTGGAGSYEKLCIELRLDDVPVPQTGSDPVKVGCTIPATTAIPIHRSYYVQLEVDHPYAASSGTYMDLQESSNNQIRKITDFLTPVVIINGWGDVSPALVSKFASEAVGDRLLPVVDPYPGSGGYEPGDQKGDSAMDHTMIKMAASYLAQYTRMAEIQKRLGNSEHVMHHMLGIVYTEVNVDNGWATHPNPPNTNNEWRIQDRAIGINVDGAISVNSKSGVAAERQQVIQSTLAAASMLEGSVFEQMLDSPFAASTAHRFQWANANVSGLKFYLYRPTSPAPAGGFGSDFTDSQCSSATPVANSLPNYIAGGFWAIAPNEKCLGPGNKYGPPDNFGSPTPSMQRGPAFLAFQPDNSSAAHIVGITNQAGSTELKGGGAAVAPQYAREFDAAGAASLLKDKFEDRSRLHGVDLQSGEFTYSAPVDLTLGEGGFPYELSFQRTFKAGASASPGLPDGWAHNLDIRLAYSGDALGKMGTESVQATAETIVAAYVAQKIYSVAPTLNASTSAANLQGHLKRWVLAPFVMQWLSTKYNYNVVTMNAGHDARQFMRFADGNFYPPRNGVGALTQTGSRTLHVDTSMPWVDLSYDRWDYSQVSFTYTSPEKEIQTFPYFETENPYDVHQFNTEHSTGRKFGWHLTNWTFPFGVTLTYTYSASGPINTPYSDHLVSVTNGLGRTLTLNYVGSPDIDGVLLSTLTDGQGRTVSYSQPATSYKDRVLTQVQSPETGNGAEITKYQYIGDGQNTSAIPASARPQVQPKLWKVFAPSDATYQKMQVDYDRVWRTKEYRDAVAVKTPANRQPWQFFMTGATRGERQDPLAGLYTAYYDSRGRAIQLRDEMNRIVDQKFDNHDRVWERTYPEGNKTQFEFDDVTQQVTKITQKPKSTQYFSTPPADIVIQASYDSNCAKIKTVIDARTNITTWNYNATTCTLTNIQQPQVPNPENANAMTTPTTTFQYNNFGQITQITDPTNRVVTFDYDATRYRWHRYENPGGLNLTTTYGHNTYGDLAWVQDPRLNTTTYSYDKMRRLTQVDAAGTVRRNVMDLDGDVYLVRLSKDAGATQWQDWTTTFTPTKKMLTQVSPTSATTTYTYDGLDRVSVVEDPDHRRVKTSYFADGKTQQVTKAYQSASITPIQYATYTLTANGQIDMVTDGNGNTTNYDYDGHDRLHRTFFADPANGVPCGPTTLSDTAPTCSANQKFEQLNYDPNGNVTTKTNRSGRQITFAFDALNQETTRNVQANTQGHFSRVLTTRYDLAGRKWDATADGQTLASRYDAVGRVDYVTDSLIGSGSPIDYTYDASGNRTGMTWPGGGSLTYTYDALNRMDTIVDNNGAVVLANYDYDLLSRRDFLTLGNSGTPATVDWSYENDDDLSSVSYNGPSPLAFTIGRNNSSQITSLTASDGAFLARPTAVHADTYTVNRLNQIATANGTTFAHDANGNLVTDGTFSFEYDEENRLRSAASASTTVSYEYDPIGRRRAKIVTGGPFAGTTKFVSDGQEEIEERNGSNVLLRRYAYGAGIDERIAMLDSTCTGGRCYYRTNWQGSTTHLINQDGSIRDSYHYGPYGERVDWSPQDADTGNPFRYTGRRYDPETGLYYYRARYYSPTLGRFLQTDPVGYEDDLNLYAYVKNDPLNSTDPSGEDSIVCNVVDRVLQGCTRTADDKDTTTVTFNQTNYWTDSDGNEHSSTSSTTITYEGSISKEGSFSRAFLHQGDSIMRSVEQNLSTMTGSPVHLVPSDSPRLIEMGANSAWGRGLGNMKSRANDRVEDVARDRGADATVMREIGDVYKNMTLKDVAKLAVEGDPKAVEVLKLVKQAERLSDKF